jgi:acetolactate synthase-1/2/3 large subunit
VRLDAPVLTTPSARGIVCETHALAMGFDVLRGSTAAANALLCEADAVIVLGAKLGHNGSAGGLLEIARQKIVRVDTSAAVLEATYPAAHALEMDVASFLARPEAQDVKRSAWSSSAVAAARAAMRTNEPMSETTLAGVPAADFFAALSEALPGDARLVTDTGLHQVMTRRHVDVTSAGGLLMPSDMQSMGFGLPAAIAARLADPSRPVVALIGDGGLRMTGFELATAVRERVALTLIVSNDGCLNQIRMQQIREFGVASGTELGLLDVGAFAAAVGADYRYAGSPGALDVQVRSAIADGRVTLIEVPAGDTTAIRAGALKARAKGAVRAALGQGIGARFKALISGRR